MASRESSALHKLNGRLLLALHASRSAEARRHIVGAAVIFTGDLESLREQGFDAPSFVHHPLRGVNIAAGWIALDRVVDVAALDHVIRIEAAASLKPEMDQSVPEIGARKLHAGIDFLPPLKGAKVVIGVIDTGFEIRHKSFRKSDETTRVIALWDQTIGPPRPPQPGQPPVGLAPGERSPLAPFNYGVEYDEEWINGFLGKGPSLGRVRSVDTENHGTTVLGIAVSNGLQAGGCHLSGHYIGVAPEAEIILVKVQRGMDFRISQPAQHAFEYIFEHPRVKGRAAVVNFSSGDNLGPHDGTSPLELAIDGVVMRQLGRAVVKSAGNEGVSNRHAEVPLSIAGAANAAADLQLRVSEEDRANRTIEGWYTGNARVAVSITAPMNPRVTRGPVQAGGLLAGDAAILNPAAPPEDQVSATVASEVNAPMNGKHSFTIMLSASVGSLPAGPWVIHLANTGNGATTVQVWLDRDGPAGTQFTSHVSKARTITTPGTAKQVITVGAYDSKSPTKKGQLDANSSHGPIDPVPIKNEPARTAPDVVAPGVAITSTQNGEHETSCCECCRDFYKFDKGDTGTSVAAPHVTGVIALMLERHPQLSVDQIRQILRDFADRPAGFTGPRGDEELNTFGFGRVNAVNAVEHVPPFFGPPPPGMQPGGGGAPPPAVGGSGSRVRLRAGGAPPPAANGDCLVVAGFAPFRPALAMLRAQVLSSGDGRLCAALVSRHFSEARALIRRNRRVAVAWHRACGPTFLRTTMRALATPGDPAHAIPDGLPENFARFFAALARYGSAALQSDLARHGDRFASLLRHALDRLRLVEPAA